MKRKLKTWEKFVEEFKPLADRWNVNNIHGYINYNGLEWYINPIMKDLFGTEIEVKELRYTPFYNYMGKGWSWHKLWFEPEFEEIEFLTEEEVEI